MGEGVEQLDANLLFNIFQPGNIIKTNIRAFLNQPSGGFIFLPQRDRWPRCLAGSSHRAGQRFGGGQHILGQLQSRLAQSPRGGLGGQHHLLGGSQKAPAGDINLPILAGGGRSLKMRFGSG